MTAGAALLLPPDRAIFRCWFLVDGDCTDEGVEVLGLGDAPADDGCVGATGTGMCLAPGPDHVGMLLL